MPSIMKTAHPNTVHTLWHANQGYTRLWGEEVRLTGQGWSSEATLWLHG